MKRIILGFASLISIILFAAIVVFLVVPARSGRILFTNIPLHVRGAIATIVLEPEAWVIDVYVPLGEPERCPDGDDERAQVRWLESVRATRRHSQGVGFDLDRNNPHYSRDKSDNRLVLVGYSSTLKIPFWFLLAISSILPLGTAWAFVQRRKRERRREAGLCIQCGYDLRASGNRCPECGLEMNASDQ